MSSKELERLRPGEKWFIDPGNLVRDGAGKLYINGSYLAFNTPQGAYTLQISVATDSILTELSKCEGCIAETVFVFNPDRLNGFLCVTDTTNDTRRASDALP